jgi:hypothetical protein
MDLRNNDVCSVGMSDKQVCVQVTSQAKIMHFITKVHSSKILYVDIHKARTVCILYDVILNLHK